ncbi:hypothetical protein C8F01DRAFT_1079919 [Mycena amicta]|nr:hypothetical protein C8F01DRAFT_1079919 [Mycena amicta]
MPQPTLSAHASRNPTQPVQEPRHRQQSQATKASKALAAEGRQEKDMALEARFKAIFDQREDDIKALAQEFNKPEKYIRQVLENGVRYTNKRGPNLKNAIRHDLAVKARENGEASNLLDIDLRGQEYEDYKDSLTEEEKAALLEQLAESKHVKEHGVRATNRAVALDAMQTANQVGRVLIALRARTGVRAIAFFTRGHVEDTSAPCIVDSGDAKDFFPDVLKTSSLDVARKFELWSCTRDKAVNENSVHVVRSRVADLTTDGLRQITNNPKQEMSWQNYDVKIVHELGVELAGWPEKIPLRRPSKIPADDIRRILDKMRAGSIKWVVLTPAQRKEVAENVEKLRESGALKKRKARSDKNTTRGKYKRRKTTATSQEADEDQRDNSDDGSDDDDDDDENDSDDNGDVATRTRKTKKVPAVSTSTPAVSASTPAAPTSAPAVPTSAPVVPTSAPAIPTTSIPTAPASSAPAVPRSSGFPAVPGMYAPLYASDAAFGTPSPYNAAPFLGSYDPNDPNDFRGLDSDLMPPFATGAGPLGDFSSGGDDRWLLNPSNTYPGWVDGAGGGWSVPQFAPGFDQTNDGSGWVGAGNAGLGLGGEGRLQLGSSRKGVHKKNNGGGRAEDGNGKAGTGGRDSGGDSKYSGGQFDGGDGGLMARWRRSGD